MDRPGQVEAAGTHRPARDGFLLDLARRELRRADGGLAELRRQSVDVLCALAADAGHVVDKDRLMRQVWPDVVVGDDSIAQAIADIRRLLGDTDRSIVRTIARRGYMLVPDARLELRTGAPAPVTPEAVATPARAMRHRRGWILGASTVVMVAAGMLVALLVHGPSHVPGGQTIALATPPAASAPVEPSLRSLVVLPLGVDPSTPGIAWFADALTAELTMRLGMGGGLFVIDRGTATKYRGPSIDPRDVARELGVRHVIRGTVARDDDRVRVELTLVDGATGVQNWGERYDVPRAELDRAVDELAGGIRRTLMGELGHSVARTVATLQPAQVEAEDLAMRGFAVYLRGMTPESFAESMALFEQALAKSPDSPRALAGASMAHSMSVLLHFAPDPDTSRRRAEQTLQRLESLDAYGLNTLLAKGAALNMRGDWHGLIVVGSILNERHPGEATGYHHRCSALLRLGRFDESVRYCERALRISPHDSRVAVWHGLIGMSHYMQRRYDVAALHARQTVAGNPSLPFYWLLLTASLELAGHPEDARRTVANMRVRHPNFDIASAVTMWHAVDGRFVDGLQQIVLTALQVDGR